MTATDTRYDLRRRTLERIIRWIDVAAYLVIILCGVFAFWATPDTVRAALVGQQWIVVLWGTLLSVGGVLGLVGRLSFIWAVELPGTLASFFGSLMYFVILGVAATDRSTAAVAAALVAVMALEIARRYVELQIFTSDRRAKTFIERFRIVLARRTTHAVPRMH